MLLPSVRVITLIPLVFMVKVARIPAYVFLLLWFAGQLALIYGFGDFSSLSAEQPETAQLQMPNIAVTAHIVGFIFGMFAVFLVEKKNPKRKKKVTYE